MTTSKHGRGQGDNVDNPGDTPGDPGLVDAALGTLGDIPTPSASTSPDAPAVEPPPAADEPPAIDASTEDLDTSRVKAFDKFDAPAGTPALLSDEGVPFDYLGDAPEHIVNLSDDPIEGRRRELHVGGKTYSHVGEYLGKSWLYRHDA
jgi:hypothetical protein